MAEAELEATREQCQEHVRVVQALEARVQVRTLGRCRLLLLSFGVREHGR